MNVPKVKHEGTNDRWGENTVKPNELKQPEKRNGGGGELRWWAKFCLNSEAAKTKLTMRCLDSP